MILSKKLVVDPMCGTTIQDLIRHSINLSIRHECPVEFKFNGRLVEVDIENYIRFKVDEFWQLKTEEITK